MSTLIQDVRYSLRQLRKNPMFFSVVMLTLGLGIGANTAIFSMVDWLVLRSLPIRDPEQMNFLVFTRPAGNNEVQFSYPEFAELEKQTANLFSGITPFIFGGLEGAQNSQNGLTVDGVTKPIQTVYVGGTFFPLLGILPADGRLLLETEGKAAGADPVVVLSYNYWQTRFSGDSSIVGKAAYINGHPVTIVGVTPKGFLGPTPLVEAQAYLPLGMYSIERGVAGDFLMDPKARSVVIFARLKPGVSDRQVQSALALIGERLLKEYPRVGAVAELRANALRPPGLISSQVNPLPKLAALFLTLAALVLGLACVNIANLFLIRASGRERELAVRAALGARNSRLVRQLLTESFVVSGVGGMLGILLGLTTSHLLAMIPMQAELPFVFDFNLNWHTFLYAFLMAAGCAVFVIIVPATRIGRSSLQDKLQAGGRSSTSGKQRLRGILVVTEVAACLTLLIVSGLFVRSLRAVERADLGFVPQSVLNLTLDANQIGLSDSQGRAFYTGILERVRALPGIQSASLASAVPLADNIPGRDLMISDTPSAAGQPAPNALYDAVSTNYFETMGMTLLRGREFTAGDNENTAPVAVINQAMAERYWPGKDPLGRSFALASDPNHPASIIGVVRNVRMGGLFGAFDPIFYRPITQNYEPVETLQIRSDRRPQELLVEVRDAVQSLAATMPMYGGRTMTQAIHGGNGLLMFELGASLAGSLGILGLILAVIGVYGLMAYSVSQRTQEIGIRMALGAQKADILNLIGKQGLVIVAIGLAAGLGGAITVARMVGDFLVDVAPTDPTTYFGVSALLAVIALLAMYIPTRRASRVTPMIALRHE